MHMKTDVFVQSRNYARSRNPLVGFWCQRVLLPVEGNIGSQPVPFAHHKVPGKSVKGLSLVEIFTAQIGALANCQLGKLSFHQHFFSEAFERNFTWQLKSWAHWKHLFVCFSSCCFDCLFFFLLFCLFVWKFHLTALVSGSLKALGPW